MRLHEDFGAFNFQLSNSANIRRGIPSGLCSRDQPSLGRFVYVLFNSFWIAPQVHRKYNKNKNLCGRDGRTICGPQCVPKSTCVSL